MNRAPVQAGLHEYGEKNGRCRIPAQSVIPFRRAQQSGTPDELAFAGGVEIVETPPSADRPRDWRRIIHCSAARVDGLVGATIDIVASATGKSAGRSGQGLHSSRSRTGFMRAIKGKDGQVVRAGDV